MKGTRTKRIALVVVLGLVVVASIFRMLTVLNQEPMVLETLSSLEIPVVETSVQSAPDVLSADTTDMILETGLSDHSRELFPVYICGSVLVPGVYEIAKGTYVYQLIEMAGGLKDEAAVNHVNQVYMLVEPISIYIPSSDDVKVNPDLSDTLLVRNDSDVYIWGGNGETSNSTGTNDAITAKVNINTAGRDELMTLSGVGQVTADAIINYRDTIAPFTCIEDIMNVPGIKTARFEAIKQQITI